MAMPLEERQAHRLQCLRAVYDASDGVAGRFLRFSDIGEELGFDERHAEDVAVYLIAEGLLKWSAMGVTELTHWCLKEVEQALSSPDEPTEHFPALVIAQNYMQVGSISNSQVQQGTVGVHPVQMRRRRTNFENWSETFVRHSGTSICLTNRTKRLRLTSQQSKSN